MDRDGFNRRLKAIYDDRNAGMGALADLLTVGVESCLERLDRMESPPGRRREGSETPGPVYESGTWGWALGQMRYGRTVKRRMLGQIWNDRTIRVKDGRFVSAERDGDRVISVTLADIEADDWILAK